MDLRRDLRIVYVPSDIHRRRLEWLERPVELRVAIVVGAGCAFAFHVTTVPLLASRAAMLGQRVARLQCDIDDSAPRCLDRRDLDSALLSIHEHVSLIRRAAG